MCDKIIHTELITCVLTLILNAFPPLVSHYLLLSSIFANRYLNATFSDFKGNVAVGKDSYHKKPGTYKANTNGEFAGCVERKEGRKEGRTEGRKDRRKEREKEGRREGRREVKRHE